MYHDYMFTNYIENKWVLDSVPFIKKNKALFNFNNDKLFQLSIHYHIFYLWQSYNDIGS